MYAKDIYPMSMQSKKIFCAYHETEFLTNFCQQKQCLMPLCPSCIAEHTQEHFQQGKRPSYLNINQALNRAKQSCYCTIVTLQQYKKLNQDIYHYICSLEQNIHIQVTSKRNEIFQLVTQIFNDYEQRLIKQVHDTYKEKNVYLLDQALNASKFIDEEITNLYEKISCLKADDCLSSLITYHAVDEQTYKQALQQFDEYFEKNRKAGKLEVSIIDEALNKITNNLCQNILSVQWVIENFQKKPQEPEETSNIRSKRYGFNRSSSPIDASRRTIIDKENQMNNRQSPSQSQLKNQKIGIISRQDKDMSFNQQSFEQRKISQASKPIFQVQNHITVQSKRKSLTQSPGIMTQDAKRLTRGFKRPVI